MTMIKRVIAVFAAAVLAALCLSSCAGGKKTLTVMGKKSDLEKSYMKSIFEQYESATGNRLKIIAYEDTEFEDRAAEAIEKGRVPDIFMHFHNSDLNRFDVENNFMYLNDESWVGDLTDSAKAYCLDADGNLLGLPFWENSVSGCYYNKTILDSLGLRPAATQAEFDLLCEVLTEAGYTPICWPADGCSWMLQFALDPIFADDPSLLEKINENKITYAQIPAVAEAVKWVHDAAEKGWLGSDYLNIGWSQISPTMASGKAVMTFIWDTWFYTDLEAGGTYTKDDFALMPVFLNTADGGTYEGGNLNMMMVNKNSRSLDEALGSLGFCATAENYNRAFDGISTVSCFKGQTTNIQSKMVTDMSVSVAEKERVSTAASRIVGYSADRVAAAIGDMLRGKTDVAGCVSRLDSDRIEAARSEGTPGF